MNWGPRGRDWRSSGPAASIPPELRQYFIESDTEAAPFSRAQRSLVYQRAKMAPDNRPFGTQLDVSATGYEWINHSMFPTHLPSSDFRLTIGETASQPYSASIFNVSAMSFGALSGNAIMALNRGARLGNFAHDTGEGSISQYHRVHGGDLIWEIGSGYFGCRDEQGRFSEQRFVANATEAQVKMIEIKLSQGAKPGHGGILPAAKVTAEIAAARGVAPGIDCVSPSSHSAFTTPLEMMAFIVKLRQLSGGKPVGFKFCVGHPWEWFGIVKAMLETGVATQDPVRQRALDVADKAQRVRNFHRATLLALKELVQAAGLNHPQQIGPEHIVRRIDFSQVRLLSNLIANVEPGALLSGKLADQHNVFKLYWPMARPDAFTAAG